MGRCSEGSSAFLWGGGPHTPADSIMSHFFLRNSISACVLRKGYRECGENMKVDFNAAPAHTVPW